MKKVSKRFREETEREIKRLAKKKRATEQHAREVTPGDLNRIKSVLQRARGTYPSAGRPIRALMADVERLYHSKDPKMKALYGPLGDAVSLAEEYWDAIDAALMKF